MFALLSGILAVLHRGICRIPFLLRARATVASVMRALDTTGCFCGVNNGTGLRASVRMFLPGNSAVAGSKLFPAREAVVYLAGPY